MKPLENLSYDKLEPLERIDCPLCQGSSFVTLVVEQEIPIVRCRHCKLVFANPRPSISGLHRFYENYFPIESSARWQKQMSAVFLQEGKGAIEQMVDQQLISLSNPPRLLDIGSGMGYFLKLMKDAGWIVQGIEPSTEAYKHAVENLQVPVYHGTLDYAPVGCDYDVISLWYVLEHVPNPMQVLAVSRELMKNGGLLILRVPNQNVIIDQVLSRLGLKHFCLINPPRHLFDYSPKTMAKMLENEGFEIIKIKNSIPRRTGTWLELLRRYLWYGVFELIYWVSGGRIIRGSSMTIYAIKK